MSKKVKVQQIQPDEGGPVYGQVSNPADFMKSQIFAHAHAEIIARDYIVGGCSIVAVAGFALSLQGGMIIRINAPGQVIANGGKSYEMLEAATVDLTIADADDTNPRIDLIVVTLETDANAADELRPFVRLRTQQELEDGNAPYAPQQFNKPTEQHNRAVVSVKTGTPAEQPVAPELASNEVALYAVRVLANAAEVTDADITNLRHKVASLCELQDLMNSLKERLDKQPPQTHRHWAYDIDIGPSAGAPWPGQTVQAFIDFFSRFTEDDSNATDPLTRPETLTSDGKLGAVGSTDSGTPVVDIPVADAKGVRVAFSDRVVTVDAAKFPGALNPRLINTSGSSGTDTRTNGVDLSLATINSIETDGGGSWQQLGVLMPNARYADFAGGQMAAARDGRYIEIMGGNPALGTDWHTFDSIAETLTPRNFTGDVPVNPIVFVVSRGDGTVLMATRATSNGPWEWFIVDCDTGASTKIDSGDAPTTVGKTYGYGTLVQANVVLLVLWSSGPTYWIHHIGPDTFESFVPTGVGPTPVNAISMSLSTLSDGKALIFTTDSALISTSPSDFNAKTYSFDYASRSLTQLNIAQPTGLSGRIQMINVSGKVYLLSGKNGVIWEFTPGVAPKWTAIPTALPRRAMPGAASLLSNGLPVAGGYFFGGQDFGSLQAKNDVWAFASAGIIETLCADGTPGITLGPGATQASFRLADFVLPWQVAKVLANLTGFIPPGSVKLFYSFNNGATKQEVMRGHITDVLASSNPATRSLWITMFSTGGAQISPSGPTAQPAKPCLHRLEETFEKTGGPGLSQLVIRYDAPLGTKALYLSRDGTVTVESGIVPTTPDKAILLRSIHNGAGVNPSVKNYINRRLIHKKFTGAKGGGVDPTFVFDFAVAPRYKDARAVTGGATGALYKIADPGINFDDDAVTVAGITTNGDNYIVECEA